ncbi:MAG: CotH kinase family protein [Caldilineae bacterium]|nr:CotH kinase family protein [Caldilineae bacterium]
MPGRPGRRLVRIFVTGIVAVLVALASGTASRASAQGHGQAPDGSAATERRGDATEGRVLAIQDSYGRQQGPDEPAPEPLLFDDGQLRRIDIRFEQSDWLGALGCSGGPGGPGGPGGGGTAPPAEDIPVTVEVDGVQLERVGIRCKGNSSLAIQGDKKPLNLDLDAFVAGQDLWGHDTINLNNGFSDPTLIREALGYRMFRDYMPVPRFGFARVTVNDEYLGLYIMAEQLAGEWADYIFPDDDGLTIKGDSPSRIALNSSPLTWKGESLDAYKQSYEVKGSKAGSDEGYVALREMIRTLDAAPSEGGPSEADFATAIWDKLDVDLALWYLAGNNLITNFDSYYAGHNYYMYLGRRDPRFSMVSWDLNLSFGLFGLFGGGRPGIPGQPGGGTPTAESDPFVQQDEASRPLIRRLLAVPDYRADYVAHYRSLLDAVWTEDWVREVGGSYQDLIRQAARDEEAAQGGIAGSFSYAQFVDNFERDIEVPGRRGNSVKPGILSLVEARGTFLRDHAALQPPDLRLEAQSHSPAEPSAADAVTLSARFVGADAPTAVELRYRVRGGTELRLPLRPDGAGGWSGTIPAQRAGRTVTYAFRASSADGRAAFFPEANWSHPYGYTVAGVALPQAAPGDLVVNELMAANTATLADEAGEFDDWVELYNRGTRPLDLDGLFLSDDPADPWAFPLPALALGAGERLLIWCDNQPEQGPLHAPFRLDRKGESVSLADTAAIRGLVEHEALDPDVSWARLPDGGASWQACFSPTPGQPNVCGAAPTATPGSTATRQPTPTGRAEPSATPAGPGTRGPALYLPWLDRRF